MRRDAGYGPSTGCPLGHGAGPASRGLPLHAEHVAWWPSSSGEGRWGFLRRHFCPLGNPHGEMAAWSLSGEGSLTPKGTAPVAGEGWTSCGRMASQRSSHAVGLPLPATKRCLPGFPSHSGPEVVPALSEPEIFTRCSRTHKNTYNSGLRQCERISSGERQCPHHS